MFDFPLSILYTPSQTERVTMAKEMCVSGRYLWLDIFQGISLPQRGLDDDDDADDCCFTATFVQTVG